MHYRCAVNKGMREVAQGTFMSSANCPRVGDYVRSGQLHIMRCLVGSVQTETCTPVAVKCSKFCMYTQRCTCTHSCLHTHTHTQHTHTHTHTHTHGNMKNQDLKPRGTCKLQTVCVCMCMCVHACMCTCVYVCVHACVCIVKEVSFTSYSYIMAFLLVCGN